MTSPNIQKFFPEQLKIQEISETNEKIIIELESQTKQGMSVSVILPIETIWRYNLVMSKFSEDPTES